MSPRHARDRSNWWPLIPGVLTGMIIGVWAFSAIWGAIR